MDGTTPFASSFNFADLAGLANLRRAAASGTQKEATLKAAAQQMEGLFLHTLLKSMRAAMPQDGLFGGHEMEQYQDMFDQQLALDLAKRGGVGIARQLEHDLAAQHLRESGAHGRRIGHYTRLPPATSMAAPHGPISTSTSRSEPAPVAEKANSQARNGPDFKPKSMHEFVSMVAPYVERAAAALGVHPLGILAQAALETGWGFRMLKREDGSNSLNFFGIKADGHWDGDRVSAATLEFRDGVMEQTKAPFRAFQSIEDAFSDYVDLLRHDPRYQAAIEQGGDAEKFVQGLQQAGYATDPDYAAKLGEIINRPSVRATVDQLTHWLR